MNIIKLLDKIKVGDPYYNSNIKGKYAYWIKCKYVIPFDEISTEEYYNLERNRIIDEDNDYYTSDELTEYIDMEETERVNSINALIILNRFISDDDITIEELKKFRTWLAQSVLDFILGDDNISLSYDHDDSVIPMLQYYANGMSDIVCERLKMFSDNNLIISSQQTSCGCGGNAAGSFNTKNVISIPTTQSHYCGCGEDASSLYKLNGIEICDAVSTYKRNIYAKMITTFSEIDFWMQFNKEFLRVFKKYIDNIVKNNFPLYSSTYISNFADCSCMSEKDAEQLKNIEVLKALSKSLQYMIDDDVKGHKNNISSALISWSSMLYERMYWF